MTLLLMTILLQTATPSAAAADPTVPAGEPPVVETAVGRGVQVYTCSGAGAAPAWTLLGPQATLVDPRTEKSVGMHSAGPTWTWNDGSALHGKVVAKRAAADAASVPWLLLAAERTGERGTLANVAWIRRSATSGGAAPADGCDASHLGATVRVPYSATYTFYGAAAVR